MVVPPPRPAPSGDYTIIPPGQPLPRPRERRYAQWWERLVAALVDGLVISAATTVGDILGAIPMLVIVYVADGLPSPLAVLVGGWLWFAVIGVFYGTATYLYEVVAFRGTGQTLGKRLLKLSVVSVSDWSPPVTAVRRRRWLMRYGIGTIGYILFPLLPVALCYQLYDGLSALWNRPAGQSVHDRYAGTVVTKEGT